MSAPSSFIIPGLSDQGAFSIACGRPVVVMEKPSVGWYILFRERETVETADTLGGNRAIGEAAKM